jgi:hypothetical protein
VGEGGASRRACVYYTCGALRAVYTRVFCVCCPVRDGAAAQQLPLLFTYVIAREKQRKLLGGGAITDGETDSKNASVDGPLRKKVMVALLSKCRSLARCTSAGTVS